MRISCPSSTMKWYKLLDNRCPKSDYKLMKIPTGLECPMNRKDSPDYCGFFTTHVKAHLLKKKIKEDRYKHKVDNMQFRHKLV